MSREDRSQLFESIAAGMLASYEQVRSAKLDSGLSGSSAESILIDWMRRWMPTRVGIRNGAVLSVNRGPTTQRDCVLFDQVHSPVFHRVGNTDVLPIEGVLGAVELNYGMHTAYDKILSDAEKLAEIADLAKERLPRAARPLSHLAPASDARSASREDLIQGLTLHVGHDGKPLLLVYAEQLKGSLSECAQRLVVYNKSVGVRRSVDGLFVLRQGFALHLDAQRPGWITHRQAGARFACLAASEGNVLLKLQSVMLKHFFLAGKIHPEGFDPYVSQAGQVEKEMSAAQVVSDEEYTAQPDIGAVVARL